MTELIHIDPSSAAVSSYLVVLTAISVLSLLVPGMIALATQPRRARSRTRIATALHLPTRARAASEGKDERRAA